MDHPPRIGGRVGPDPDPLGPVLVYWQGLRRGRPVPARTDLDPAALQPWLAGAGIVERDPQGRIRFRLGGRMLGRLFGIDARGMPLRALFAVGARDRLAALAAAAFDGPQVLRLTLVAPMAGAGARPALVQMAVLPLSDGSGAVTRALVCVDVDPRAAIHLPCRFHIRQAHLSAAGPSPRLTGLRVVRRAAPALTLIEGGRG